MDSNNDHLKLVGLVTRARLGDREGLSQLAELVEGRLLAYIYRLTLDLDLARELLQETLLEMVESVSEIKHPERFWFWLFRTALGKVQHHFRGQQRRRKIQLSAVEKQRLSLQSLRDYDEGLDELVRQELSGAVFEAMDRLRISHRNVLALRCFEQMPYAEIAVLMDCSEIKARVLFCRAKMALRKRLSHHGFSKAYLLVALGLVWPADHAGQGCFDGRACNSGFSGGWLSRSRHRRSWHKTWHYYRCCDYRGHGYHNHQLLFVRLCRNYRLFVRTWFYYTGQVV